MRNPMLIWEGKPEDYDTAFKTIYRIVCKTGEQPIVERQAQDALGSYIWVPAENLDEGKQGRLFSRAFVDLAIKIKKLEEANAKTQEQKPLLD